MIARMVALWFGAFTVFGLAAGRENLWWIDVRPLPQALLAPAAAVLLLFAAWPARFRVPARAMVLLLIGVLLWNSVRFFTLPIDARFPVPFTLVAAAVLALVVRAPRVRFPRLAAVATLGLLTVLFPLAQVFLFGTTNYARDADVIAVFGARCYADGRPSQSLEDRVRTACALYHEGRAPVLFLSGGPGDGAVHETESMRALALELGVPDTAIVLDRAGFDTHATVAHTPRGRVLAVSHFYHLPRIQLCYRTAGRTAFTAPAEEAYTVSQTPLLVMREVAAFWAYFARGAVASSSSVSGRSAVPASSAQTR